MPRPRLAHKNKGAGVPPPPLFNRSIKRKLSFIWPAFLLPAPDGSYLNTHNTGQGECLETLSVTLPAKIFPIGEYLCVAIIMTSAFSSTASATISCEASPSRRTVLKFATPASLAVLAAASSSSRPLFSQSSCIFCHSGELVAMSAARYHFSTTWSMESFAPVLLHKYAACLSPISESSDPSTEQIMCLYSMITSLRDFFAQVRGCKTRLLCAVLLHLFMQGFSSSSDPRSFPLAFNQIGR